MFNHLLNDFLFFQSQFSRPGFLCPHRKNDVDWTLCRNANPHLSGTSQREGISPPHVEIPFNTEKKCELQLCNDDVFWCCSGAHWEDHSKGGFYGRRRQAVQFWGKFKNPSETPSFKTDISSKRSLESSRIVGNDLEYVPSCMSCW